MEDARAQKRRELQSNALVRVLIGGSDEDLKPLTPEEQDLLDGKDMEHLIIVDTVVCRLNDDGEIIAPPNMAERYAGMNAYEITGETAPNKSNSGKSPKKELPVAENLPKKEPIKEEIPKAETSSGFEEVIDKKPTKAAQTEKKGFGFKKKEQAQQQKPAQPAKQPQNTAQQKPAPQKNKETPVTVPVAPVVEETPVVKVIPTHAIEILEPVLIDSKKTKAYFAVAFNKNRHKGAYAYVIKQPDNSDKLFGTTMETDIATDPIFIGIKVLLEEFEAMDLQEITISASQDVQEKLRRNSTYIVDGFTPAAGDYLGYIKTVAQKKYIALSPRESRLDIHGYVQQIANGLAADFAID